MINIMQVMLSKEGGPLVRRWISAIGHLTAMAIMLKLAWTGQLTEGYLTIYSMLISGHAVADKLVARLKSQGE